MSNALAPVAVDLPEFTPVFVKTYREWRWISSLTLFPYILSDEGSNQTITILVRPRDPREVHLELLTFA